MCQIFMKTEMIAIWENIHVDLFLLANSSLNWKHSVSHFSMSISLLRSEGCNYIYVRASWSMKVSILFFENPWRYHFLLRSTVTIIFASWWYLFHIYFLHNFQLFYDSRIRTPNMTKTFIIIVYIYIYLCLYKYYVAFSISLLLLQRNIHYIPSARLFPPIFIYFTLAVPCNAMNIALKIKDVQTDGCES